MRRKSHDGTLFVDKCQINLIMVNMELFSWLNFGLFAAITLSLLALAASLRAAARLGRLLNVIKDLDWDSVADLAMDVQKLKKQVQRYKNDENAQMRSLQKNALHQAADQVIMEQLPNVTSIKRGG